MAIDGTLYTSGNGLTYTLYNSTDGGFSWAYTGEVKDNIVALATAPNDASIIYYATSSNVYKSTDTGNSFTKLSVNPRGADSNNIEITSIDIALLDNNYIIAVGARDTDSLECSGVYILDENKPFTNWIDTNIGSYDAYAIAFSPNFASDQQIVAVITNETDTMVTTKMGSS